MKGSLIPCIAKFSIGAHSIGWYEIYKKVSTLDSYKPLLQSFDVYDEYRLYLGVCTAKFLEKGTLYGTSVLILSSKHECKWRILLNSGI